MAGDIESELMAHVEKLCVEIGPRMTGTAANKAAGAYIRGVFERAGLEVEEQWIDCPTWTHDRTILTLDGERLDAAANTFSPACDVTAPTVAVCTVAELEAADLAGKVGVLTGDLTRAALTPQDVTLYEAPRDQHINHLLVEKNPAALITVNLSPPSCTPIIEDWLLDVPSATVPAASGLRLMGRIGEPIRLRIDARRGPESSSATVVGRKPGARRERITLMAHYDTKYGTPGAIDNGGGSAALLALAGMLAAQELDAGLEFIAFTDEETFGWADPEYIRLGGDTLGEIVAAVNLDGVGQALGTNTIAAMSGSEAFRGCLEEVVAGYPGVMWIDPWPQSNHSTFAWRGVPSVALTASFVGVGVTNVHHRPEDTVEWLGPEKLVEAVSLTASIVSALRDKPVGWTRPA
jgi:aminopeptidase YwaD